MAVDAIEPGTTDKSLSQDPGIEGKSTMAVTSDCGPVEGEVDPGEVQRVDEKYYSKFAVYLMMIFAGLAVGSDG